MSEEAREQFMTRPTEETLRDLEAQRQALGFLTSNALALVFLNECAQVPPEKVWLMLAKVRSYHRIRKPDTKGRGGLK